MIFLSLVILLKLLSVITRFSFSLLIQISILKLVVYSFVFSGWVFLFRPTSFIIKATKLPTKQYAKRKLEAEVHVSHKLFLIKKTGGFEDL